MPFIWLLRRFLLSGNIIPHLGNFIALNQRFKTVAKSPHSPCLSVKKGGVKSTTQFSSTLCGNCRQLSSCPIKCSAAWKLSSSYSSASSSSHCYPSTPSLPAISTRQASTIAFSSTSSANSANRLFVTLWHCDTSFLSVFVLFRLVFRLSTHKRTRGYIYIIFIK